MPSSVDLWVKSYRFSLLLPASMEARPSALKDILPLGNVNKGKNCLIKISFLGQYIKQNQHVMLLVQYQFVHPRRLCQYNWFSSPSGLVKWIQAPISWDFPAIGLACLALSLPLLALKMDRMGCVFCLVGVFLGGGVFNCFQITTVLLERG